MFEGMREGKIVLIPLSVMKNPVHKPPLSWSDTTFLKLIRAEYNQLKGLSNFGACVEH